MATECRLYGSGGELHAVEAVPDGVTPQALLIRVGKVSDEDRNEPGIWVYYQEEYAAGPRMGPVLVTPAVWHQLNRTVERQLRSNGSFWHRFWRALTS